jgi:hypothetical protein
MSFEGALAPERGWNKIEPIVPVDHIMRQQVRRDDKKKHQHRHREANKSDLRASGPGH